MTGKVKSEVREKSEGAPLMDVEDGTTARHGTLSYRWNAIGVVVPWCQSLITGRLGGEKGCANLWNLNKAVVCPKTRKNK